MKRRLYYLLPDAMHAKKLHVDLANMGIPENHVHAIVNDTHSVGDLGDVHTLKETDRDYVLEWMLWRANLLLFGLALLAAVAIAIWMPSSYIWIPLVIMAATFLAGVVFVIRLPAVHWHDFVNAIHHGEILMMVDVPVNKLNDLDHRIHRLHPEAINGGTSWAA